MFNLKSFVLNRRFLAKPKRVTSLWSFDLSKTFLLICLLVITGGVNLRVSAADITYKLLGAGDAIKTDGTKYAIQLKSADVKTLPSGNSEKANYFLGDLGLKLNNDYLITLSNGGTYTKSIDYIIGNIGQASGQFYLFTFEKSGNKTLVKNVKSDTYWGNNTQSRPYRVDASSAKPFTYSYDSSKSAFSISLDGKRLNVLSKSSHIVSGDSKYANNLSYYNIYEIVESAAASVSYKFFDTSDKEITALAKSGVEITEGSTVASLSGVTIPSYVNATYYTDAAFTSESEVAGTSTPEADKTYYVKTRYKSGMPFVLGGTYFALGNGSNYLYNHDKTSGNDQYAIKMSGDWYNGFVVQDYSSKSSNFLSDADGTFSGTANSKLQIELTGDNYFLKSVSTDNYISLSADAVSYVANIALATPLSNLSATKAGEILAAYPAARYVGTYSSTQTGVAFDDIVKGNGKIALDASKYYFVEQAANTAYLLSSVNSSQKLIAGTTVYAVSGSNGGDNFAALWSFNKNELTNINANEILSPQAELGAGKTATVGPSSVSYDNPQNIQAYTISP